MSKCNLCKVKLRANAVSSLLLRRMWSVGWPQGPLFILWLTLHLTLAFWADLCRSGVKENLCGFWLPALPSLFWGVCVLVSMGSGEYFPVNSFSMTMPVGSCMQQWFLLAGLPWIPPCYAWGAQVPVQPLRHQFPSSSIDDEFKYSVSRSMNGPNQTLPKK